MADLRNFSKPFLSEFIELYRSLPAIWKIKSREYSNRDKKNAAYQELVDLLKTIEPNADREMVIKKINSLRSCYRKEKKKVADSLRSGNGTDEVYASSLWYYDMMAFVDDQDTPLDPVSNFNEEQNQNDYSPDTPESVPPSTQDTEEKLSCSSGGPTKLPPRNEKLARRKKNDPVEQALCSMSKRLCEKTTDDFDVFGKRVAGKLRSLPREQCIFLEKVISDAIFEADLGNLTRNSIVYTPTSYAPINSNSYPNFPSNAQPNFPSNAQPNFSALTSLSNYTQNFTPRPISNLDLSTNNEDQVSNYSNNLNPYSH